MLNFESGIDIVLFIIEVIGCISFATSGAITALRKKADILGVWILTLISIFGGGLLRDLIMGQTPHIFWDFEYLVLALITLIISTFWFLIAYFNKTAKFIDSHRHDFWIYLIDAIGIGVFCIYGVEAASRTIPIDASLVGKYVYLISLGVITGVGGGMFRDVFIGQIPMVFRKHFYMTPCIFGSLIFSILFTLDVNHIVSICIGVGLIVILRTLATIYKWNLPVAKAYNQLLDNEKNENI